MKIGLVLSGGGARCIAHLGLLHGLEEIGVRPNLISGVSGGALIGALYAAGHSPKQILEIVKEHTSSSIVRMVLSPTGLFSSAGIRNVLKAAIPQDDFDILHIPLFVTATDICKGVTVTFSKGRLFDAVLGSTSVPGLFTPVKFDQLCLVDGGVLDNLPVTCIRNLCDKVIGAHVNKLYSRKYEKLSRPEVMERCFHLAIARSVSINALLCDLFIEPPLAGYSMFEIKYADQIFDAGYRSVMEKKQIIQLWAAQPVRIN